MHVMQTQPRGAETWEIAHLSSPAVFGAGVIRLYLALLQGIVEIRCSCSAVVENVAMLSIGELVLCISGPGKLIASHDHLRMCIERCVFTNACPENLGLGFLGLYGSSEL